MLVALPFVDLSELSDPAMKLALNLCGGHWHYAGPKIQVDLTFKAELDGKMVAGEGIIHAGKVSLFSHSRFGWDPVQKKVYYLDTHQQDTVYFGHVIVKDGVWTNEFSTLVGADGHWVQRAKLTDKNTLDSSLYSVSADGTEKLEHHFVFKRTKK